MMKPAKIESSDSLQFLDESEVPDGWEYTKLGEIVSPSKEKIEPTADSDLPYIGLEHIESNTSKIIGHDIASKAKSTKTVFHSGDVLYGKLRPYLNKVTIPDFEGVCSTDILVFNQNQIIDSRYLMRFLSTKEVVEYANLKSKGISLPRVSFESLALIPIPLPPLAEQQRIVARVEALLSHVNAARERVSRVPLIMKKFRQAVLAAACSGRLTEGWREENTDEIPAIQLLQQIKKNRQEQKNQNTAKKSKNIQDEVFETTQVESIEIPDSWVWCQIQDIAQVQLGGTPSRKESTYWGGTISWISSGEVANNRIQTTRERITESGLQNSSAKIYPTGTVLIAMIGEGKTRGQSAMLDIEAATNQNVAGLVFDTDKISNEFVWLWALSQYEKTRAVGRGGEQPALNGDKVRNLVLALPPLAEQHEIVRRVGLLFERADAIDREVAAAGRRCERLTQAVLGKAFRGELVGKS